MIANEPLIALWCLHDLLSFQKELTHYIVITAFCQAVVDPDGLVILLQGLPCEVNLVLLLLQGS